MRCVVTILLLSPIYGWSPVGGVRRAPAAYSRQSYARGTGWPVMSAAGPDEDEGVYVPKRLQDEEKDSALEIDASAVVVEVDERGSDDGTDEGLDAAVIIVGAGAAGIGTAVSLVHTFGLDPSRVLLLERGEGVGTSFRMWPEEMSFISPSFNQAGWTSSFDLNSVAHGSSPAYTLHAQHPSGAQCATAI